MDKQEEELLERVKMLMVRLNVGNTSSWAKELGLPQTSLEKKIRGVQKFSVKTLSRILEYYPNVSAEWLLRGRGEMFSDDEPLISMEEIDALRNELNEQADKILKLNEDLTKKNKQIDVLLTEKVNLYNH